MGLVSTVKRRILMKLPPVVKRVIFPLVMMVVLLQVISTSNGPSKIPDVLPGEALDPLVKPQIHNPRDRRPSQPFETIMNAAVDVDEQLDERDRLNEIKEQNEKQQRNQINEDRNEDFEGKLDAYEKKVDDTKEKKMQEYVEKNNLKAKSSDLDEHVEKDDKDGWSMHKLNVPGREYVEFDGHKITEKTVTLTIMSSEDKVFMSINKREIYRGLEDRGVHIVVLHPHTGKVMAAKVFDTFHNGTEIEMGEFLDNVQTGRIVTFAIRDEAATGLTWRGRSKLKEYGSKFADRINYRDMWILVTRKGSIKMAESYSNVAVEDTGYEWGGPLFLRTDFDLTDLSDHCNWQGPETQIRQDFCQRYEGYGKLCHCSVETFDDVFFKGDGKQIEGITENKMYDTLTVAILAKKNPHYLFKTLTSLKEAPGMNPDRVIVYVDTNHREIIELTELFGVRHVVTGVRNGQNVSAEVMIRDKIQFIYRDVMGASFAASTIPEGLNDIPDSSSSSAEYIVILDDDVRVSIDFFKYLHSLAPVLSTDDTVLGITAFSYNSFSYVADSLTNFYRTDRSHQIALMMPAKSVHEYIVPYWPKVQSNREWYRAIALSMQKNKLEIIYPEVGRAKHFGFSGFKIMGSVQYTFFHDQIISYTTDYTIPQVNIDRLKLESYKNWRTKTLKEAEAISFDFCTYDFAYGKKRMVVYVDYDGKTDDKYLTATLKCLGAWSVYPEGGWKNTWDFTYHGHPLTVVADPGSQYSRFKPADYKMKDLTTIKDAKPH